MERLIATVIGRPSTRSKPGEAIRFTASTAGVKRDGKDLNPADWYLENYRKSPVVLWAHDYGGQRPPIGRAEVLVDGKRLIADVKFDQGDEFARTIERKYRDGYLHAVSVGWGEIKVDGRTRYDLHDVSAVPVPGDPDAVMERAFMPREVLAVRDEWAKRTSRVVNQVLEPVRAELNLLRFKLLMANWDARHGQR